MNLLEFLGDIICKWQNKGAYLRVNRDTGTYYDCTPTITRPMAWYARRSLVAGFTNTKRLADCNAQFVNIGRHVFVRATKFIPAGTEIFVFYHLLEKYM